MCFDIVSRMNEARDPRCFFGEAGGGGATYVVTRRQIQA